jgi:hypothetical protein
MWRGNMPPAAGILATLGNGRNTLYIKVDFSYINMRCAMVKIFSAVLFSLLFQVCGIYPTLYILATIAAFHGR